MQRYRKPPSCIRIHHGKQVNTSDFEKVGGFCHLLRRWRLQGTRNLLASSLQLIAFTDKRGEALRMSQPAIICRRTRKVYEGSAFLPTSTAIGPMFQTQCAANPAAVSASSSTSIGKYVSSSDHCLKCCSAVSLSTPREAM